MKREVTEVCDGMMFPKKPKKKKRKRHRKSILHCKDGTCYLCMKLDGNYCTHSVLHDHHVYGGPSRPASEREGFKVYLCLRHHTDGPEAVHNNKGNRRILQRDCQRVYERNHTRQQFMELIGRNYLEEENG